MACMSSNNDGRFVPDFYALPDRLTNLKEMILDRFVGVEMLTFLQTFRRTSQQPLLWYRNTSSWFVEFGAPLEHPQFLWLDRFDGQSTSCLWVLDPFAKWPAPLIG
jgi:hypothetical protein